MTDPEQKRKIIGAAFIDVFESAPRELGQFDFLAQGTLYPDVIESVSVVGPSATIKSHHNVGGLPERMRFKLVEPLRELFKDEVRARRHDARARRRVRRGASRFPGPGWPCGCSGAVTRERLDLLRRADAIVVGRSSARRAGIAGSGRRSPCCCRCRASA